MILMTWCNREQKPIKLNRLLANRRHVKAAEDYLALADPQLAELIERFGRCALKPWQNEPFSTLITSIISQQLSVKAADTIVSRALQSLNVSRFSPRSLASAPQEQLRQCGLSNAKAGYCKGIAEAALSGQVNFAELTRLDPQQVIDQLICLKGVGVWTAEMFLIFGIGHSDIWSYGDLGLKKGVALLQGEADLPCQSVFEACGENWRPYRSVVSWYLWRLVESQSS